MDEGSYTREALVRDLIGIIGHAEGKPIYFGSSTSKGGDRAYITEVASHAIDIVNRLNIKTT